MGVNKTIITSIIIIMAAGLYNVIVVQHNTTGHTATVTRVVVGAYLLGIVASIVDLISGPAGHVAGLMLTLALGTALLAVVPDLGKRLSQRK